MKTATQLKDKIKNLAKEKNLDPLILSKNYMMERFLERIALSAYGDHFKYEIQDHSRNSTPFLCSQA